MALSSIVSSCPSRSTCQNMTAVGRCTTIFVAVGIITLIGAVLCLVFAYRSPLAANTLTYSATFGLFFGFASLSLAARIGAASRGASPFVDRLDFNADDELQMRVRVNKSSLLNNPRPYLKTLAQQIENHVQNYEGGWLRVEFEGRDERGIDGGGLTREYLDDMMRAITNLESQFRKVAGSALAVPMAQDEQNFELYRQLGEVIMFCYPTLQIGFHLDPSVFRVALSLSAAEIEGSYDALSFERKLELYNVLTYCQEEQAHEYMLNLLAIEKWSFDQIAAVVDKVSVGGSIPLDFIQTVDVEAVRQNPPSLLLIRAALKNLLNNDEVQELLNEQEWCENQIQVASRKLLANEVFPDTLENFLKEVEPNISDIANSPHDLSRIRVALQELITGIYDPQVRGIYALAKGMKSVCIKGRASTISEQNRQWDGQFCVREAQHIERSNKFSTTLQGRVDKTFIAERICYNGQNEQIRTKVGWLKEWVRDEQTDDRKIRELLKFSTGSSSLASDKYLNVTEQSKKPFVPTPIARTCTNQIALSVEPCGEYEYRDAEGLVFIVDNPHHLPPGVREVGVHDRTKAGFIRTLEAAISGDSGFRFG